MQGSAGFITASIVAFVVCCSTGAHAQGTRDVFERIDRDGDRAISQEEFRNYMAATYGRKDADGNRILSWAELHPEGRPRPADWVDFSLDDVMAAIPTAFSQRDRDGDNMLSREEMAAAPPGSLVEDAAEAKATDRAEATEKPKE